MSAISMDAIIGEEKERETINEVLDGELDTFIADNKDDLVAEFIDRYNFDWQYLCKMKFRESQE